MFFNSNPNTGQPTDPNAPPQTGQDLLTDLTKIQAELSRFVGKKFFTEVLNEMYRLNLAADAINKNFLGARTMMVEMAKEVANAAPGIVAMGGKFSDVADTISKIAAGSRRNVIATTKDVKELFAVGQIVNKSVTDLVDNFAKAGIQYGKIGEQVGESIQYVNSLGINARSVMEAVVSNTEQLQRFNFEGGVKGLSKMAAQASMLRFDMAQTFKLAEDVLDPERAIEVASAFQRLGVSAGNLVDPFQLMNQSINDPSGLQDSLINISKQFTYFDEKSKSYKINPQGILTLREMEKQTGVSAKALRDAAISAADFDERLAAINARELFPGVTEDDKKLLANMARMGESTGEYEINIGGEYKKVSELNAKQLQQVVEEQKKGPKSVEEIQKNQLNIQESLLANAREINQKLSRSLIATDRSIKNTVGLAEVIREASKSGAASPFGTGFQEFYENEMEKRKKAKTDEERKAIDDLVQRRIKDELGGAVATFNLQKGEKLKEGDFDDKIGGLIGKPIEKFLKELGISPDQVKGRGAPSGSGKTGATTPSPSGTPARNIQENWLRGKAGEIENNMVGTATGAGGTGANPEIDVKFPDKLPPIYLEKGPSLKDTDLRDLISKGGVQLGESIFKLVEETAQRLGYESRLPGK